MEKTDQEALTPAEIVPSSVILPGRPTHDGRGKFAKGNNANPKGRPRTGYALSDRIREKVDPDELIEIALSIARGHGITFGDTEPNGILRELNLPKASDRIAAINFLAERGWIKPPVEHFARRPASAGVNAGPDLTLLTDDELASFKRLYAKTVGIDDLALGDGSSEEDEDE